MLLLSASALAPRVSDEQVRPWVRVVIEKPFGRSLETAMELNALVLSLVLLPMIKGALIGLQWALRMHGFGAGPDPADPMPDPAAHLLEPKGRHV